MQRLRTELRMAKNGNDEGDLEALNEQIDALKDENERLYKDTQNK